MVLRPPVRMLLPSGCVAPVAAVADVSAHVLVQGTKHYAMHDTEFYFFQGGSTAPLGCGPESLPALPKWDRLTQVHPDALVNTNMIDGGKLCLRATLNTWSKSGNRCREMIEFDRLLETALHRAAINRATDQLDE